jgi:hypothetical protein
LRGNAVALRSEHSSSDEVTVARRYEYQVCSVQSARVTWVNGSWQGTVAPESADHDAALKSCPTVWEYLQGVGYDGWELTASVAHQTNEASYEVIYLRRER